MFNGIVFIPLGGLPCKGRETRYRQSSREGWMGGSVGRPQAVREISLPLTPSQVSRLNFGVIRDSPEAPSSQIPASMFKHCCILVHVIASVGCVFPVRGDKLFNTVLPPYLMYTHLYDVGRYSQPVIGCYCYNLNILSYCLICDYH